MFGILYIKSGVCYNNASPGCFAGGVWYNITYLVFPGLNSLFNMVRCCTENFFISCVGIWLRYIYWTDGTEALEVSTWLRYNPASETSLAKAICAAQSLSYSETSS